MDDDDLSALGAAVRRARGAISQSEAARRSGVSRQWWIDIERGQRVPRADMLAQALIAVDADIEPVFELADLDPSPYVEQQERWRAARNLGADIAPIGAGDEEITPLDADILDVLLEIRTELRRLGDAYEQLAEQAPVPPPPASRPTPRGSRGARRAAPSSE